MSAIACPVLCDVGREADDALLVELFGEVANILDAFFPQGLLPSATAAAVASGAAGIIA